MKKITELRICDWLLMAVSIIMLISSIQLECWWLGMTCIWLHIALGITLFGLIAWHLFLHFNWRNWAERLRRQKSHVTKWLAVFACLTLLTAIMATIHMFVTWHHSALGGWHGMIGFVFLVLAFGHMAKRIKFYRK